MDAGFLLGPIEKRFGGVESDVARYQVGARVLFRGCRTFDLFLWGTSTSICFNVAAPIQLDRAALLNRATCIMYEGALSRSIAVEQGACSSFQDGKMIRFSTSTLPQLFSSQICVSAHLFPMVKPKGGGGRGGGRRTRDHALHMSA